MSNNAALSRALEFMKSAERCPEVLARSMPAFRLACQEGRWVDAERHRNEGVAALEAFFEGVRSAFLEVHRG